MLNPFLNSIVGAANHRANRNTNNGVKNIISEQYEEHYIDKASTIALSFFSESHRLGFM
jgi:hypothetical protein